MKWIAVESSAISALRYEDGRRRLGIEFRESRQIYFYYTVPRWEFEDFLKAESKGRYLTQVFLPGSIPIQVPTRVVGRRPEVCSEIAQQHDALQIARGQKNFQCGVPIELSKQAVAPSEGRTKGLPVMIASRAMMRKLLMKI